MTLSRRQPPYEIRMLDDMLLLDWVGPLSGQTTLGMLSEVLSQPGLREGMALLVQDSRPEGGTEPDEIVLLAAQLLAYRHRFGPIALLVDREMQYGVGRILNAQSQGKGVQFEVFSNVQHAVSWLRRERAA